MNKYRESVEDYLCNRQKIKESKESDDQKWSTIIEGIFKKYEGTEIGKLMQLKYVQRLPEQRIFDLLNVEKTTYYAWRNRLVNEITLQAAYQHLIKPF
jgi:predicted phage-related endonuclease